DDLGSGGVKVAERVAVARGFEPIGRLRVTKLRLVAEREQKLLAARLGAPRGNGEHLFERHVRRPNRPRRFGEGAVGAAVTAEMRERGKDFSRIRDDPPLTAPPD